jgi:hypothetical protein
VAFRIWFDLAAEPADEHPQHVDVLAVAGTPHPQLVPILLRMARFVYIDETGTSGRQPFLTIAAALVDEEMVQPLAGGLRRVAMTQLGWLPADFEFHGRELWHGEKHWSDKQPAELIAAYEAALALLEPYDIWIAHATINKPALHDRYEGAADGNAYRLALQFLLEKVDRLAVGRKVLVADEAKEQELRAVKMVADMQEWGGGEVPPSVWIPDEGTRALRRQVARRAHIVRQRTRLKNQVQAILHRNLIPRSPAADLFGHKGRAWLAEQNLPPDERQAVEAHLRQLDFYGEELRVADADLGRVALDRVRPNASAASMANWRRHDSQTSRRPTPARRTTQRRTLYAFVPGSHRVGGTLT